MSAYTEIQKKYSCREAKMTNGATYYKLFRYDEDKGLPDNATLQFWFEIMELKALLGKVHSEIASYHIDWAKLNHESPDYDPQYKIVYPDNTKKLLDEITEAINP